MKKFHFERGVKRRTRVSFVLVALLLFAESVALQHYYMLNFDLSASAVDVPYLEKLQSVRDIEKSTSIKLIFVGDVMLARGIGSAIDAGQDPFQYVLPIFDEHDIQIANVETTIADPKFTTASVKPYTFNAPLTSLQTLKRAGIDVSSLANNHTGDFGREATIDTIAQFKSAGLTSVGAGRNVSEAFAPKFVEENGIKIAFIAVNDIELNHTKVSPTQAGSAYLDIDLITQSIADARSNGADAVVILPHWGVEYSTAESEDQRQWGRFMIDAGADLVIGSHPHVVQPTEQYNGGQIVYSLGNFIFDGMSGEALEGQMVSVELTKTTKKVGTKSESAEMSTSKATSIPILIDNSGFPRPL